MIFGIHTLCLLTIIAGSHNVPSRQQLKSRWPLLARPRCPPAPTNCTVVCELNRNGDYYRFHIDGKEIGLLCEPGYFVFQCLTSVSRDILSGNTLPSLIRKSSVPIVQFSWCDAPQSGYAEVFKHLNITGIRSLILTTPLDRASLLTGLHFANVENITSLSIEASIDQMTFVADDVFVSLINLTELTLYGNISVPIWPSRNNLRKMFIVNGETRGGWGGCAELRELNVSNWRWITSSGAPAPRWLASCTRLQLLNLNSMKINSWPPDVLNTTLVNLKALQILKMYNCGLRTLQASFLVDVTSLRNLDLSNNDLIQLPSDLLLPVAATLETLDLGNNPRLSGFCGVSDREIDDETAPLRLPVLRDLSLIDTNVTRICARWRRDLPALLRLALVRSRIREIQFQDIKWLGATRHSSLELWATTVRSIVYEVNDYLEVIRGNCTKFSVTVGLSKPINCDCHSYWFARTLAECPAHVALGSPLRCSSGQPLGDAPLSAMVCERYPDECAPGCRCYWRERRDAVIANCTSVEDGRFPLIPYLRELNAASSKIEQIDFIPTTLLYADMQYNKVARMSAQTATALFSVPDRRLRFTGNRFYCDCENKLMIEELQRHREQVLDYDSLQCVDERTVENIVAEELCALSLTLILLYCLSPVLVLLVVALVGFGYFSRHQQSVMVYLYARGWCLCCIHEHDVDRHKDYDAFVSYSHVDEQFVYEQLIPQLEGEPYGFRLCVHTRDWVAGEWIPVQIARTVENSRRTIILLSRCFLDSIWGRLEFRTAHKAAMREKRSRVIIILLEQIEDHPNLDNDLKSYLTTNTYVKWGDPYFWDKLREALPHRIKEFERRRAGEDVAMELLRMEERPVLAICAPPTSDVS